MIVHYTFTADSRSIFIGLRNTRGKLCEKHIFLLISIFRYHIRAVQWVTRCAVQSKQNKTFSLCLYQACDSMLFVSLPFKNAPDEV